MKKSKLSILFLALIISGVLATGSYFLLAYPAERGGLPEVAEGFNPYFVGICSNDNAKTCSFYDDLGLVCGSSTAECKFGTCSNSNNLCNPYVCDDGKPCGGLQDLVSCRGTGDERCDASPVLASCGTCQQIRSDLDNCPGGPSSANCFDPDFPGVQVNCKNIDQGDRNLNLYGDICDSCGNGILDPAEECDYGTLPFCGGPNGQCNAKTCIPDLNGNCSYCDLRCNIQEVAP